MDTNTQAEPASDQMDEAPAAAAEGAGEATGTPPAPELGAQSAESVSADGAIALLEADKAALAQRVAELEAKVDELETANGVLEAQKQALTDQLDKAKSAPSATPRAGKVRKIGPIKGDSLSGGELLEAIRAAETVELAFSDGRQEILAPRIISGDAWAQNTAIGAVMLRGVDLTVFGPAMGQSPYVLAGYGLLLDGKQVAWAQRGDVLPIGPNQQVNLSSDVVF